MTLQELLKMAWYDGWHSCHEGYINGFDQFKERYSEEIKQLTFEKGTQQEFDELIEWARWI